MRKWKLFSLFMFAMLGMITNNLMAQTAPISGSVLSDDGTPMAGATVTVSGTKRAVITNEKGKFTVNVNDGALLEISHVGYTTQRIKASAGMEVQLSKGESAQMEDVVVTAMGIKKERK